MWGEAFRFLASQPETASLMLGTFRETLEQMGVEPSGVDPVTGEPRYSLSDVAMAMRVPESQLDVAITDAERHRKGVRLEPYHAESESKSPGTTNLNKVSPERRSRHHAKSHVPFRSV